MIYEVALGLWLTNTTTVKPYTVTVSLHCEGTE